jgi:hypothetical protein
MNDVDTQVASPLQAPEKVGGMMMGPKRVTTTVDGTMMKETPMTQSHP